MRRTVSALFLVVGLALLASAFLAAPAARTATSERILRVNVNSTDITYLDPALSYDFYGWRLESSTCAFLLAYLGKTPHAYTLITIVLGCGVIAAIVASTGRRGTGWSASLSHPIASMKRRLSSIG